nr:TSC22 domain family protein 2 [Loxodonta africana]
MGVASEKVLRQAGTLMCWKNSKEAIVAGADPAPPARPPRETPQETGGGGAVTSRRRCVRERRRLRRRRWLRQPRQHFSRRQQRRRRRWRRGCCSSQHPRVRAQRAHRGEAGEDAAAPSHGPSASARRPALPPPPPLSPEPRGEAETAARPAFTNFKARAPPPRSVDGARRKSEPLPQAPLALLAENKPVGKPPGPEAPAHALQLTPMNSLATSVFSIAIPVDGDEDRNPSTAFYQAFHLNTFQESKSLWDSASGGGVVAIDNKIEQAMDLVKSHLMYAVREEVEVLKEQIKELVERNSLLERENALLKSLSNSDQLSQLPAQQAHAGSTSQQQAAIAQPPQPSQPPQQPNVSSA